MTQVENFDNWSEDAKWLICYLLTCVPDEKWGQTAGRPQIDIRVEGFVITDLQQFFEGLMQAFRSEVRKEVAEEILQRFEGGEDLWHEIFQSARQALKDELRKTFGVNWNHDGDIYDERC